MRESFWAKLNKSEDNIQKTVPLAPTVRRSIASSVRVPGLEYIAKDSAPSECEHCYGLGLLPIGNIDFWSSCLWCKTSNLHVLVCRVDNMFLAVRDGDNLKGWGENVIDALLQLETKTSESDSIWSEKYTAKKEQNESVSITVHRRTYAILQKLALLRGCSFNEILAKFAVGNIDKFDHSEDGVSRGDQQENLNAFNLEQPSGDSTSRTKTG